MVILGAAVATAQEDEAQADLGPSTVVATVNGEAITLGHMAYARALLPAEDRNLPDDVLFEGILAQLVQRVLLAQAVEETPQRIESALEVEGWSLLAGTLVDQAAAEQITDEAVSEFYTEFFSNFRPQREFNASHILVASEEEAATLGQSLADGADFAELAQEHSTGPSGPEGGLLGWFGPGAMVPAFEAAVSELEVGQVSEPVQTEFGWHLILLNETRLQERPTLEVVRREIVAEMERALVEELVTRLRDEAEIEGAIDQLDPAILKDPRLLSQ
ncbi:MAG: peptidylprolyl isomerase [Rhodobacteraceae bacterium]|nr:peptidylprolyl isomerase [Paracoccaceae bacterium]